MKVNPRNVIDILTKEFRGIRAAPSPSQWDIKIAMKVKEMLSEDMTEYEEEETLVFLDGSTEEKDYDSDEEVDDTQASQGSLYQPSQEKKSDSLPDSYLEKAHQYRFSCADPKGRLLSSIQSHYRRITSMSVLSKYAARREKQQGMKKEEAVKLIGQRVLEQFKEYVSQHKVIKDRHLRQWGLQIKSEVAPHIEFKASHGWCQVFKKRNGIVSRKTTKFVTKVYSSDQHDLNKESKDFVTQVRTIAIVRKLLPSQVLNADQSKVEKEMHSGRTHRFQGEKTVLSLVQSESALTHSYTIMPVIDAAGNLYSPMYMKLKETGDGSFPPTVDVFQPKNVAVFSGTSSMMNKEDMVTFFKSCYFKSNVDKESLLVVDQWPSWKDKKTIATTVPRGFKLDVENIPAKCTPIAQPLDSFFFRQWKLFIRYIYDFVIGGDYVKLFQRNNLIKLQSLVHHQFSAPIFREYRKYSWYKTGYLITRPEEFETPIQYCIDGQLSDECQMSTMDDECDGVPFIRCAHCTKSMCFNHFFLEYHICTEL